MNVDFGRKIPSHTRESNSHQYCTWFFSLLLNQLSYTTPRFFDFFKFGVHIDEACLTRALTRVLLFSGSILCFFSTIIMIRAKHVWRVPMMHFYYSFLMCGFFAHLFFNVWCSLSLKPVWCIIGWELPQVSFLLRQKCACHDKTFVATNIYRNKHVFVVTEVLSWQAYFSCNKRCVLSWQNYVCHYKYLSWQTFCHDKNMFVMTSFVTASILLSRQKSCFVATNMCVMTKLLSWQKWYLWQLPPTILMRYG